MIKDDPTDTVTVHLTVLESALVLASVKDLLDATETATIPAELAEYGELVAETAQRLKDKLVLAIEEQKGASSGASGTEEGSDR